MSNTNKKWEKVKLGDLFDLYAGGDVDRNNFSPIKTSTHLYPIYSNSLQNEGLYGYTSVPKYKGNSITITGRGFVGIPMYREQPFDAIIRLLVLTPKDEKQVNGKFVSYYISQYVDFPKENTGVPQLTIPKICDIELPIPSIDEQERIVNIIETKLKIIENANKVCSEQTFVIEKLFDSYLKKIVNTKKKYEMVKLDDLCKIERGGSPRPIEHYLTKDKDGINWIKIGDAKINSKYIDNTAEKIIKDGAKRSRNVKVGDLILSNSMSFGRPYILNIDGCIHDGWLVFSNFSNDISKDYLYYILSSSIVKKQFENEARGAIVKNLNIDIVKEVIIPLPKMTEQANIVKILDEKYSTIEKVKDLLKEQSSYIDALSSSILRKAFNGEY